MSDPHPSSKPAGPLIVLSGPSGVGKSTIVEKLLATSQLPLRRAVTATTRRPRPGEEHGRDYYFWSVEEFQSALQSGKMLEHAIVHGTDYYGTPRAEVDDFRGQGLGVICVIDVQGAAAIRKMYPEDHLSIFLTVPAVETLRSRLEFRGDAAEKIERRLHTAEEEFRHQREFDHVVVNTDLSTALGELHRLIDPLFARMSDA